MSPPVARGPFAGPGERRRQLWRAAGEALVAGVLALLAFVSQVGLGSTLDGPAVPALALPAIGLALVRRRFPAVSLLGLAALAGALQAAALLTAVAAHTAARQTPVPRRRGALLLGGMALVMLTGFASAPGTGNGSGPYGLAVGAVLAATTVLVPGLVGAASGQQDRLLQALRERTAAAEEARRLADSESRMHERSRIAAEMHDLVGHRLSLISLHAGGLEMALRQEAPSLRDEAALVRSTTRDAMRELREALGVLGPLGRDTGTDALTDATGTRADIEALAEESRKGGIPVELSWQGEDLDARSARVRRAVHRVVRESLTNVHRYAPGARVTVAVTHTGERVEIQVRNGAPPAPAAATTGPGAGAGSGSGAGSGRGLPGLRERVALLGGTFEAGRTPDGGFSVAVRLPADPPAGGEPADAAPYAAEPAPGAAAYGAADGTAPDRGLLSRVQRGLAGAVTGVLGLAGVGVMMLFGLVLVDRAQPGPDYSPPGKPRLGMSREQVTDAVGRDDEPTRAAATGHEPRRPASATDCVHPWTDDRTGSGRLRIVRYCFRSDTLIAIDRFTVPLAPEPHRGGGTHD
ncbi:histidine kinase [Streptomyces boncukensis]|uniref:histidine kinase n=1 Tax=Streptomyces boncukensis TaxID=2711219 RepID=A0A6G4X9X3_9ACTN|nr:two-component sensor histidine kinase [Streptomyces boncukensis]